MSLKDRFLLWRDYYRGKYPNLKASDLMAVGSYWPSDSSVEYNQNYENLFRKIIDNAKHISEFSRSEGLIDHFYIHFENGNRVEFMIDVHISTFIEDIKLYNKDGKRLFKFEKGKPKKSTFIEFLNEFSKFLYIKDGKFIDTNTSIHTDFIDFFKFDEEKEDGTDNG